VQNLANKVSNKKIKKIVFLVPLPICQWEEKKWCLSYLRSEGFQVDILDLSELIFSGLDIQKLVAQPLTADFVHRIYSFKELDHYLKMFSDDALFFDFLVGHADLTINKERVFRLLKKNRVRYTFLSIGMLPLPSILTVNKRMRLGIFFTRALNAFLNPYKFIDFIAAKGITFLTHHSFFYPQPIVIFGGGSEELTSYMINRNINEKRLVKIHSYDYDVAIFYKRSIDNSRKTNSQDICVFLDEAATHHSDYSLLGMEVANPMVYFAAMNRFFDFIESNSSLKVIIAAHPRSNYESMPGVFGERAVVKGNTVELVANSKLVVMHMSTSLSYAVLFKKPIIPIIIPGNRLSGQMSMLPQVLGEVIGSKAIDLDKDELTTALLQRECNIKKYAEYERLYVRTEGADDLPIWEIIVKTVKNM